MWEFTKGLSSNSRPDGRENDKFRDILLNWGSIKTADGSSIVKLGNTTVVCGLTFNKDEIELNTNDQTIEEVKDDYLSDVNNLIEINVKYQPHCSFSFKIESNEQDLKESLIITTHFKQILKNAQLFDLEQLIQFEDKKVILNRVLIEILIENYDGNAFDACNLSLLATLLDCKLNDKHLKLDNFPVSTTFCFKTSNAEDFNDLKESKKDENNEIIFYDPSLDDEKLSDGLFNIVINADSNQLILLNKTGGKGVSIQNLKKCISIANKRASTIKNHLKSKQTHL